MDRRVYLYRSEVPRYDVTHRDLKFLPSSKAGLRHERCQKKRFDIFCNSLVLLVHY